MPSDAPSKEPSPSRPWVRAALLALGVLLTAIVVSTGVERILQALRYALPLIPALLALDVLYATCEVLAHRSVLGLRAREIPLISFLRVSMMTYCTSS